MLYLEAAEMFDFVGSNVLAQITEQFRTDIAFNMKQSFVKGTKTNKHQAKDKTKIEFLVSI